MAPKKYIWSSTQEDRLMDLFEDNDYLYQPATKDKQAAKKTASI